jgi:hypothetical protein
MENAAPLHTLEHDRFTWGQRWRRHGGPYRRRGGRRAAGDRGQHRWAPLSVPTAALVEPCIMTRALVLAGYAILAFINSFSLSSRRFWRLPENTKGSKLFVAWPLPSRRFWRLHENTKGILSYSLHAR